MTENELKPYMGSMDQLAGIRTSVLDDGKGRGVRIADVDNGSGLRFTVLLDRGMDIGPASFKGTPVAYQTPVGTVHPAFFEPDGLGWLRSFGGGLLVGCGLRNVGIPSEGEGLHGRLSNTPAETVAISKGWKNGRYELSVSGVVREASFFGENLELRRTISTAMGDNSITISDQVTNRGVRPSPLMMLYHINAGFPLLTEASVVEGRVNKTVPRTDGAAKGLDAWGGCQPPTAGYAEQCFFHDIEVDSDKMARLTLRNPDSGMAMEVAYRKAELPHFIQWKMMGEQEYVMGLEPTNAFPDEKKEGEFKVIESGETIEFKVAISLEKKDL